MVDVIGDQDPMNLPPGFRFHPLDVELITDYLSPKAMDHTFCAVAIGEVDLNKCEPWDIPRLAKMGEKEWYFFVVKDRKYPTGMRTNRATEAGYWKATGKDKEIFKERSLVGMKKTLVFYKGRAPKGEKSNWVMHEYRLEGETSLRNLPVNTKNEWVICRIFHKNSGGKKVPYPELMISNSFPNEYSPSGNLPPLTESSPGVGVYTKHSSPHVSCFSNTLFDGQTSHNNTGELSFDGFNNHPFHSVTPVSNPSDYFSTIEGGNPYFMGNYMMSEQNVLRAMLENQGTETKQSMKTEEVNYNASQDNCLSSDINAQISSVVSDFYMGSRSFDVPDGGAMDVDQFLNYR